MKIVCGSCGAKYAIADEKVGARTLKIRCKKCEAPILVRAAVASSAASAASTLFDDGAAAIWHVLVGGEQEGPFAPAQLGAMLSTGTIAWDAYVWREGLEDWKAAEDVAELVQAIMRPSTSATTAATTRGADLFAQSATSAFAGDDDVVTSASPASAPGPVATGARNENSVLFSLSNLQSLATASAPRTETTAPSTPASRSGAASGDASGLIDIRALARATGLAGSPVGASAIARPSPARVDELLGIGAPSVGLATVIAPPVTIAEAPTPARGSGAVIAAAAIVALAVLGGAGIFAYASQRPVDPAGHASGPPLAPPSPPPTAPATSIATAPTTTDLAAPPSSSAPLLPAIAATEPVAPSHHARPSPPRTSAPRPEPTAVAPPPPARPTGDPTSLDGLIERAVHPPADASPTEPTTDPALPATPAQGDVRSAMSAVAPAVSACGAAEHGVATVSIAIAGATGRVSSATVTGSFAGTPVGSCVARAVRGATFPRFRQASFSVSYPFRL